MDPNWGDVPTWVTAIATVLLFIGAVVTAIYAIRAFRLQRQQLNEQLAEQRRAQANEVRAQANKVAAWLGEMDGDRSPRSAWIRNASDLPVYSVSVSFLDLDSGHKFAEPQGLPVVGPSEFFELAVAQAAKRPSQPVVAVKFTDAAGRTWERDVFGNLAERETPPAPFAPSY